MKRHRALRVAMLATVLLAAPAGAAAAQEGESREVDLVDSRVLELESSSIIREDEEPAIDRTSRPDEEMVSLRTDVLFEFGSAELNPEADRVLDRAVSQIEDLDPTQLVIVGHTDHVGSDADNQTLSEDRAAAVDRALSDRLGSGAPSTDVSGRGESEPVAPNELPDGSDNPDGRALNRRVEVEVIS